MLCYCIDSDDTKYVLICRRGSKTSESKDQWNLPSGFLGWNESGEDAAVRETLEETGVKIPIGTVKEIEHSTDPKENKQHVIFRYSAKVPAELMKTRMVPIDKEEIKDIKWISENEISDYSWAFNHGEVIKRLLSKC